MTPRDRSDILSRIAGFFGTTTVVEYATGKSKRALAAAALAGAFALFSPGAHARENQDRSHLWQAQSAAVTEARMQVENYGFGDRIEISEGGPARLEAYGREPRASCEVILPAPRTGREIVSEMANLRPEAAPSIPDDVALRFAANVQTALCIDQVQSFDQAAGKPWPVYETPSELIRESISEARRQNNVADVFAVLREMQLGTPIEHLETIRDARFAGVVNPRGETAAQSGLHAIAFDSGDAIADLLEKYDEFRKDPDFLEASSIPLMAIARMHVDKYQLSADGFEASVQTAERMRIARAAGAAGRTLLDLGRHWPRFERSVATNGLNADERLRDLVAMEKVRAATPLGNEARAGEDWVLPDETRLDAPGADRSGPDRSGDTQGGENRPGENRVLPDERLAAQEFIATAPGVLMRP
ncbi:MAG: hypothetical protein ING19_06575 [Azospirillum sp.]|nr:hypothetical protein [Azospirillum sp.]